MNCLSCNKKTNNPKFCNRSCAATYNNRVKPKRAKATEYFCHFCNKKVSRRSQMCQECLRNNKHLENQTLGDVIYSKGNPASSYSVVRYRARQIAQELGWSKCKICGYDKHIEICHIKAIKDYSHETLISVINNPSNLIGLCPNCHWEIDNGITEVPK